MGVHDSYDCNGTGAQQWVLNRGSTAVRLANTNLCLDAGSNSTYLHSPIHIHDADHFSQSATRLA